MTRMGHSALVPCETDWSAQQLHQSGWVGLSLNGKTNKIKTKLTRNRTICEFRNSDTTGLVHQTAGIPLRWPQHTASDFCVSITRNAPTRFGLALFQIQELRLVHKLSFFDDGEQVPSRMSDLRHVCRSVQRKDNLDCDIFNYIYVERRCPDNFTMRAVCDTT